MPQRRPFTVEEYLRLEEVGILHEDDPVELIEGEIVLMAAQGPRHAGRINWLIGWFVPLLSDQAIISVQTNFRLSANAAPEPDLLFLRFRPDYYDSQLPGPDDVLLIIEVAVTSLRYDRDVKQYLYATAGIPEFWIVDLTGEQVLVYRRLRNGLYTETTTARRGDTISPLALPDLAVAVAEILGSGAAS